jgi:hypothetical protein
MERGTPSWVVIALSCIVAGCANEPRFSIDSSRLMSFPPDKQQEIIRSVWPAGILATVATRSRAPASDHEQILAVIGELERQGTAVHPPCNQLKLIAIENWQPVRILFAATDFLVTPKTYLDHWRVAGCGNDHSWLVYDDESRGGELTISHAELPMKGQPTQRKRIS